MKQFLQVLFFVSALSCNLSAQVPTVAPDFTVEDIEGKTHNLYDILGSGKTVVLDFYTTWCPPCWSYHNGRELHKLWDRHGKDGLDDYVIISIESDRFTGLDDIRGTGDDTLGDWTEDVGYIMVDNDQIQNLYNIVGYPTYVQICTDRTAKEMDRDFNNPNSPIVDDYLNERLNCNVPTLSDNVTAYAYNTLELDICDTKTFAPNFDIMNSGINDLTSFDAKLYIDNVLEEELAWSGNLMTYQHTSIIFNEITLENAATLKLELSDPNASADSDLTDNTLEEKIKEAKTAVGTELELNIRTDTRSSATYWAILDENENIVAEGGNTLVGLENIGNVNTTAPDHESAYEREANIIEKINLENNGCYTLVVTDYNSDGMCCFWGVGRYVLKDGDGKVLAIGGQFEEKESHTFRYEGGTSSVSDNQLETGINIWPNPVSGMLNIELDLDLVQKVALDFSLTDLCGKELQRSSTLPISGKMQLNYDMSSYANGVYFVTIKSVNGIVTKKIIKN